jgi:hypothetical protein
MSRRSLIGLWQGAQGMRIMIAAFTLGAALLLGSPGPFGAAAQAQDARVVRQPPRIVVTPLPRPTPWDYNIIPRYRYRPEDDRVDPYGPPVAPVIRYGDQEIYIQPWYEPWY